jgi:DNA-directed RNA polymerase subunit F
MLGTKADFKESDDMGLSDLFKRPASEVTALNSTPLSEASSLPQRSAKLSHETLQFKEGRPYLALIGQTFDIWGVVDVVGETRSHIAVKNVSEVILKRAGVENISDVAFDRKLILTHTKGFHDLPREEALEVINTLNEDLMSYVDDMKERLENALQDYDNDAKGLREFLRDTEKEYREYWAEDLARFRGEVLPQALVEYWETQRDEHELAAQMAEQARLRAIAKIRKTPPR